MQTHTTKSLALTKLLTYSHKYLSVRAHNVRHMIDTQVVRTVKNEQVGDTTVQQENVTTDNVSKVGAQEFTLAKFEQVLWFLGHFIAALLGLRFIFLLLGANLTGIVLFIYDVSGIFVLPFRGVFPSPRSGEFFLDTASLLGIAMYYLLIFLLINILRLFSKRAVLPNREVIK